MFKKKYIITFIMSVVLITACVKDKFNLDKLAAGDWNPEFAAPLAYGSLTIGDIVAKDNSGLLSIDANGLVTLVYRGNLVSLRADELLTFPDQTSTFSTTPLGIAEVTAINLVPNGSTYTQSISQTFDFSTGGTAEIDTIFFKTGSIDISYTYDLKFDASIVITIPSAKKNGQILSKTIPITYAGTSPVTGTTSIDISGYKFDMTKGGTVNSKFDLNIDFTLTKSSQMASVGENLDMDFTFKSPTFSKLFGYILQPPLTPNTDTVNIDIFNTAIPNGSSFSLYDPKFKIIISNSYGLPISGSFSQLTGLNNSGVATPVAYIGTPNPLNPLIIPTPTIAQIGQVAVDSFTLNKTNSNIATVLNTLPKQAIYAISTQANPNGKPVAPNTNFVLDTSEIKVDMEVILPMYGQVYFAMQDTSPFKMESVDALDKLVLRTYMENGFPVNLDVQIYFTDSISPIFPYHIVDSLNKTGAKLMPAATVNATTGEVISKTTQTLDLIFDKIMMDKMKNVNNMIIKATINTPTGTDVKFYSDYNFDVKLGVQARIKAKL